MTAETFFLQVRQKGKQESYQVTCNAAELVEPAPRESWQRYALVIEEGKLVHLEKSRYLTGTEVFTLDKHKGQVVRLHSCSPLMGCKWQDIRSNSAAVQALLSLIHETLATPVKG